MPRFGKELPFMMVRSMERNNTRRILMISKHTVKHKKLLVILESLMLQLYKLKLKNKPQPLMLRMLQVFHTLTQEETTILEHQPWIQMVKFGKELPSMMERSMEKRNIKQIPTTSRLTEKHKKQSQILESHMLQHCKLL